MSNYENIAGELVNNIKNQMTIRFDTKKAQDIVVALNKSGVPFSARYDDREIRLVYDGSFEINISEIIKKAMSGRYELLLREIGKQRSNESYLKLLSEVAEIMHTTVGTLKQRPKDIQILMCKAYTDHWLCDTYTIQRELDRYFTVNGRTRQDMDEHEMKVVIPAEEIAYIHDAKSEKQKADMFDKVRSGNIRVLLGSTAKMGTGTNVQKKLIAVHDLDIPWRPADLEQRAGRIIRQGNENKKVQIFRYVTKGTFDAYSYQTLENKQRFISQIMTSKTPARKCEDVDQQALTYSEIKALCTGDERVKEKLMLENDVKELRVLAAEHKNTVYEMEDKIKDFPEKEKRLMAILDDLHTDREALRKLPIDPETKRPVFSITIGETVYTDKTEAGKALNEALCNIKYADTPTKIGSFQGFELTATLNSSMNGGGLTACLKGAASHTAKLNVQNIPRIESALYNIDGRIENVRESLAKLRLDYAEAKKIVAEPFPQQAELERKEERLATLTEKLNQAAIEAKKNAPKREQTCYFERAKMRKEAKRVAMHKSKFNDKLKSKSKNHGLFQRSYNL